MEQHLPTFLPTRRGLRQQNLPTYLPACLQLDAKTTYLPTYHSRRPKVKRPGEHKVAQLDIRLQNGLKIVGGHLKPARKSTFCTQKGQNFLRAARRPKIASRHGSCRQKLHFLGTRRAPVPDGWTVPTYLITYLPSGGSKTYLPTYLPGAASGSNTYLPTYRSIRPQSYVDPERTKRCEATSFEISVTQGTCQF